MNLEILEPLQNPAGIWLSLFRNKDTHHVPVNLISFVLPTTSILTSTQRNIESFQIISLVPILEPSQDASFISSST
jgi:hypothetical protein